MREREEGREKGEERGGGGGGGGGGIEMWRGCEREGGRGEGRERMRGLDREREDSEVERMPHTGSLHVSILRCA